MKVTILLGSVREERQSHRLAYYLQNKLLAKGTETALIDLMQQALPIFGQRGGDEKNVEPIRQSLAASDALLFVTPEYHGSFSGVLKNALDYYWPEFSKKTIAVAAASGGKMGGINASTQLQHVILSLGAYPLPLKLLIPEIHKAFDDTFTPMNESVAKSTDSFLTEFLWFAEAILRQREKDRMFA